MLLLFLYLARLFCLFLCLSTATKGGGLGGTTYQTFRWKTGAALFFQVLVMHCRMAGLSNGFTS